MEYEKSCGCVIVYENKVLLVEQKDEYWGFPKGHMEGKETEIQTAIREVKEETNVDAIINESKRYVTKYYPNPNLLKEVVFYLATCKKPELQPQEAEIRSIEWLPFEDAIERLTFEDSKEILRKAIKDLEN